MPMPPPTSMWRRRTPAAARSSTSSAIRVAAATKGAGSTSREPMWQPIPTRSSSGMRAAAIYRRFAAGCHHTRELAARDDVEASAEAGEQRQHGEVGVRLDRIADECVAALERRYELAIRRFDCATRVDVAGGAEASRDFLERHV